jgi:hypothetical protein
MYNIGHRQRSCAKKTAEPSRPFKAENKVENPLIYPIQSIASQLISDLFADKQPALFKKSTNSRFIRIYSKKLLTLMDHIRIMRSVLGN